MDSRPLAVFFAKKPEPGQVKTRLCPPLDPVASSELYHCLVQDVFNRFGHQKHGFQLGVAYWPKEGREYFERMTPAGTQLFLQKGPDLQTRLVKFFEEAFADGFGPVIVMGSDVPFLDVTRVEEAFESLASMADLVVGPDPGGSYYLIGLRKPEPDLFQGLIPGETQVRDETLRRAESKGLRTHLLAQESDLDYPEDLLRFVDRIIRRPKLQEDVPALFHFLRELGYFTEIPNQNR